MAEQDIYTIARFWSKVAVGDPDECWLWRGGTSSFGHGRFRVDGRLVLAHRFSYELIHGPIPITKLGGERILVLHSCDEPRCVNPEHLRIGTHRDNVHDARERGRLILPPVESHRQKLTAADVQTIRRRLEDGERPSEIASAYNVDPSNIRQIQAGKIWRKA